MIEFMVIGLPRSGTTWVANWLTTDTTLCVHDPLFKYSLEQLDCIPSGGKTLGVSCTGLMLFQQWVNRHPARRVILHRPIAEVNESLKQIGLPTVDQSWANLLDGIVGWHLPWTDIYENPAKIYEYLLNKRFDCERHQQLKQWIVSPNLALVKQDPNVFKQLIEDLHRSTSGQL